MHPGHAGLTVPGRRFGEGPSTSGRDDAEPPLVLNLVVGPATAPAPPAGAPSQTWRRDGDVCAWAEGGAATFTMTWPGLGAFRVDRAASDVVASPLPGVPRDAMADVFARGVVPVALLHRGYEVLHASAVRLPQGLVAFCAPSGTGKSTLAYALAGRGHRQWSDDALVFRIGSRGVVASRLPFVPRLGLRQRRADESLTTVWPPSRIEAIEDATLAAVYVLERVTDAAEPVVRIDRLAPASAFMAVLPQAHEVDLGGEQRQRRLVDHYLDLAATVPVFRLAFPPDLERLPMLAESVERQSIS